MGKKKKALIGLAIILSVVAVVAVAINGANKQNDGMKYFKVSKVEQSEVKDVIYTSGKVEAKDTRNVLSDIGGKIKTVNVKEGDKVKKGDLLFEFDSFDMENQIKSTQLQVDIGQENLKKLTNQSGKSYAISEENAKNAYEDAKKIYADKTKLYEAGAVSKTELDSAKSSLDRLKNDYDLAKNSKSDGLASDIKIQKKQIESTQLTLEKMKKDLEKTKVIASIDGIVSDVTIKESDYVMPSTVAMVIEDSDNLQVITNINEYDIKKISLGQEVIVKSDGYEEEYIGKVSKIDSSAKVIVSGQSKETVVEVAITFDKKPDQLKPNFSVNLEIVTNKVENALVVPYEALYEDQDKQTYVFRVGEDTVANKVHVVKGIQGDLNVEIKAEGLKVDDTVVLNPTDELKDGDKVKGREE